MARPLSLSLEEHALDWLRRPWPIAWSEVFGRAAPLALEIGFGNGAFLAEEAARHPERDHLGIELSWTAATHLFRRIARARLANVRVLGGDAEVLLAGAFAPQALSAVFVNHPCPWPKARHAARRLLRREFLALLAERMRPLAPLTIVTDHAEHAAWLHDELAQQTALVSRHATVEVSAIPGRTPTKYERKAMAAGVPIHYFEWRKVDGPPPEPAARAPSELEMPTLTLGGDVASAELFRGFRPLLFRERHREVEVVVKLLALYRRVEAPAHDVWLIETLVQEDRLRQQFALDVVARAGSVLLKPSALGEPHPTHGVKRAVWCAARWLESRHPALRRLNESLGVPEPAAPWPTEDAVLAAGAGP